jgi:hypothetical protein
METLFVRYFDGDLSESEARDLLEKVASDPKLEKELRAYERVLGLGRELTTSEVPPGFTERVMREVAAASQIGRLLDRLPGLRFRWAGVAVAAATVVLAYIGGWWVGQQPRVIPGVTQDTQVRTESVTTVPPELEGRGLPAGSDLRYVRLYYVPTNPQVRQVSVAGTFNDWDPDATPLKPENGVWVTILVLRSGTYEYMFVENNERWVTDPLAVKTRDDGFGGTNAVLDIAM